MLGVCFAAGALASAGALPSDAAAVVGVAAVHGGLIAAALVWNGVSLREASVPVALLALARAAVAAHPVGAVGYLAVPLWLALTRTAGVRQAWLALTRADGAAHARVALTRAAKARKAEGGRLWWRPTVIGAVAGALLALHLFVCASRTLGYGVRVEPSVVLPALAYDLGANVISAELFFRGAVLARLWRRWSFAVALAASAGATALRYCLDPFAATTELRVGAAVYMTLLAILNGVLYRWSGSLLPGIAAAAVFFAGYRLIGHG